jgi:hypothetical protein
MTESQKEARIVEKDSIKPHAFEFSRALVKDDFEELHEEAIKSIDANPVFSRKGLKAQGMTDEFDASSKKNDEVIRKELFKDDPEGFEMYKRMTADYDIKKRQSIVQYEQAQVAHGLQEENNFRRKSELTGIVESTKLAYSGAKAFQASRLEGENYQHLSILEAIERSSRQLASPEEDDEGLSLAYYTSAQRAEAKRNLDTLNAIDTEFSIKAGTLYDDFRKSMIALHRREMDFQISMGLDEKTAYNAACSATRADMVSAMRSLIDSGNGEFVNSVVLPMLKDPDAIKVFDYERDKDGKEIVDKDGKKKIVALDGVFDISGRLFLEDEDLRKVEQYLATHVSEERTRKKLVEEQYGSQLKKIVYDAQVVIDSVYDKAAESGDAVNENLENELADKLNQSCRAIDAIYSEFPSLTGSHYRSIMNYYRTARNRYIRAMNMSNNCKNEAEFIELLGKINSSSNDVTTIEVPILDENGETVVEKIEMDSHKAYLTVLSQARRAGFCKGEEFGRSVRAHTEPMKRANRIQEAINSFLIEKHGAMVYKQDGIKKESAAGTITIGVNKDGSLYISGGKKGLSGVKFEDAIVRSFLSDIDADVESGAISEVVKILDDFCISSPVTPSAEELRTRLNTAFADAQKKRDAKAFSFNLLTGLKANTVRMFDKGRGWDEYDKIQERIKYYKASNLPIPEDLKKQLKDAKIYPSFQAIRAAIMPSAQQMKRRIASDGESSNAEDFVSAFED